MNRIFVNDRHYVKSCLPILGCGFNVSNANPTICINDVISSYNKEHNTSLPLMSKEKLMARTISIMENLISEFEKNGRTEFCKKYYQRWMHG